MGQGCCSAAGLLLEPSLLPGSQPAPAAWPLRLGGSSLPSFQCTHTVLPSQAPPCWPTVARHGQAPHKGACALGPALPWCGWHRQQHVAWSTQARHLMHTSLLCMNSYFWIQIPRNILSGTEGGLSISSLSQSKSGPNGSELAGQGGVRAQAEAS